MGSFKFSCLILTINLLIKLIVSQENENNFLGNPCDYLQYKEYVEPLLSAVVTSNYSALLETNKRLKLKALQTPSFPSKVCFKLEDDEVETEIEMEKYKSGAKHLELHECSNFTGNCECYSKPDCLMQTEFEGNCYVAMGSFCDSELGLKCAPEVECGESGYCGGNKSEACYLQHFNDFSRREILRMDSYFKNSGLEISFSLIQCIGK